MDNEEVKPPQEPVLYKILCCPVNNKIGSCIAESLYRPYEDNDEDMNMIVGIFDIISRL